jgi:hypothetical protein
MEKKLVCTNCGMDKFKDGFLTGERGLLYHVKGKPGLKKQLFGKKQAVKLKICSNCGKTQMFVSPK